MAIKREFTVQINNFNWEQVFIITKNELGNGKVDLKSKSTKESDINFNIFKISLSNLKTMNNTTFEKILNLSKNQFIILQLKLN